jgi:hypothetical protein
MSIIHQDNIDTQSISKDASVIKNSVFIKTSLPSLNKKPQPTDDNLDFILNKIQQTEKDYDSTSIIDSQQIDNFQENVKNWIESTEKIDNLKQTLGKLQRENNKYKKLVMNFMSNSGVHEASTSKGKVKFNIDTKPGSLGEKKLKELLVMYYSDAKKADEIYKFMKSNVKERTKNTLELIKE